MPITRTGVEILPDMDNVLDTCIEGELRMMASVFVSCMGTKLPPNATLLVPH